MILPYLIAAFVILSSTKRTKSSGTTSIPNKGIIYTCGRIEIRDLPKFRADLAQRIEKYLESKQYPPIPSIDFLDMFANLIKQYNPTCYKKILTRTLTTQEKIATLLFISEVLDTVWRVLFADTASELDPYYVQYKQKIDLVIPATVEWLAASEEYKNVSVKEVIENFQKTYKYP